MFHESIKEATREAHQRLEKQVILQLKQIRTPEDYGLLLSKFYRYFHTLEQRLEAYINDATLPDHEQRRKASRLRDDLIATGAAVPDAGGVSVPAINNVYDAFGALYVMEGSVMGGSIIIKMLEEKSGIRQGYSFFRGYGAETHTMWQRFRDYMNALAGDPAAAQAIIGTANDTFDHFSILFQPHEQEA